MPPLQLSATSSLQLPPDSYIYSIVPCQPGLAVLCSDDSVRVLDSSTLKQVAGGELRGVHDSATCLQQYTSSAAGEASNTLVTTGRDGRVRFWDLRTSKTVMEAEAKTERQGKQSFSALAVDSGKNCLVAGTELEGRDGPGDAPIFVWDTRNPTQIQHMYSESHTDTITELKFHPSQPSLLLTSSTDSLITLIDVKNPDEDDAVYQVINHKSALHHAGFLDEQTIYGLGTDETLSFYPVQNPDENIAEPNPIVLGDVRERLGAEYVVDIVREGSELWVAAGNHSSQQLELVPLTNPGGSSHGISWNVIDGMDRLQIGEAHGEEIVRDVYVDAGKALIYSCGEDGKVKAWKSDLMIVDEPSKGKRKKDKSSRIKEGRYKPY